jgi:hypothetical protein
MPSTVSLRRDDAQLTARRVRFLCLLQVVYEAPESAYWLKRRTVESYDSRAALK